MELYCVFELEWICWALPYRQQDHRHLLPQFHHSQKFCPELFQPPPFFKCMIKIAEVWGQNNINLTNGLFTRKEEYPTSRLGEEEMQQRLVSTGFGFLYYLKENIPSHKTHVSKAGLSSTDKESF